MAPSAVFAFLRSVYDREHFGDYRNFEMNLSVGVENPQMANETMIRASGMRSIVQADERTRFDGLSSEVAGWLLDDEVDMTFGPGTDIYANYERACSSGRLTDRLRASSTASSRSSPLTTTGSRTRMRVAITRSMLRIKLWRER